MVPARAARSEGKPLIAVVGDAALDIYLALESMVGPDEKVTATDGARSLGGTGANAAAAVARLGGRARLHAVLGRDGAGDWIWRAIAAAGVEVGGVQRIAGRSTIAVIVTAAGHRTVIVDRGVADEVVRLELPSIIRGAALIYLSAVPIALATAVLTHSQVPVVVGIEARQAEEFATVVGRKHLATLLGRAAATITNAAGAEALATIRALTMSDGPLSEVLITTRGAAGSTLQVPGRPALAVPAPVVQAIDPTGAGDCFAGAFCHFLAAGESLERATRLATVAGSLATTRIGAQASLPTAQEVLAVADGER